MNKHAASLFFITALFCLPANAIEVGETFKKIPMKIIIDSVEAVEMNFQFGLAGSISAIKAKGCDNCPEETFRITQDTQFIVDGEEVSREKASLHNGKAGIISFYPETKDVTRVTLTQEELE